MTCGHVTKPSCEKCQQNIRMLELLKGSGPFTYYAYRELVAPRINHIENNTKKLWVLYCMNTLAIFILGLVLGWLI